MFEMNEQDLVDIQEILSILHRNDIVSHVDKAFFKECKKMVNTISSYADPNSLPNSKIVLNRDDNKKLVKEFC